MDTTKTILAALVMMVGVGACGEAPFDGEVTVAGKWSLTLNEGDCAGEMSLTETAGKVSGTWSCDWSPANAAVYQRVGLRGSVGGDVTWPAVRLDFRAFVYDSAGTPAPWLGPLHGEYAGESITGYLDFKDRDFPFAAWR